MKIRSLLPPLIFNFLLDVRSFLEKEKKYSDPDVKLKDKFWLWRAGFYSAHKNMYGLDKSNMHNYLANKKYRKIHPINGIYSQLIDSKAFLPLLFENTTNIYLVFEKGVLRYQRGMETDDLEELAKAGYTDFIMKPLSGSGGKGVEKYKKQDVATKIKEKTGKKESFIVQEEIQQHTYSKTIFPNSVNTIRILLYRNIYSKKICVAGAAHRFGTSYSEPVDNAGKGGMIAPINLENGVLGKGYIYRNQKYAGWHSHHPNTKEMIEGAAVPNLNNILDNIVDSFDKHRWFEYGGIDIVLTDEDNWVLLEINSLPDPELIQISKPLLSDKNISSFFQSKGLIV